MFQYFRLLRLQLAPITTPTVDDDEDVIVEVKQKLSVVPLVSEESEASSPTLSKLPSLAVSSIHSDVDDEASGEEHTKDFVYDRQGRVVPAPQLDLSVSSEPNDPNDPTYLPSDESTTSWPETR
jgi:hypothetical protein